MSHFDHIFLISSLLVSILSFSPCLNYFYSLHYLYWFPCLLLFFLYLLPTVFLPCFHTAYLPLYSPPYLSLSFPSLPLPLICLDSLSAPGLNHQDLLVGPNHGSVSLQRGFCLLTVETNDLHAFCLHNAPQHLEAVEVITVICLTRQVTANSGGCSILDVTTAVA